MGATNMEKSDGHRKSLMMLSYFYWIWLLVIGTTFVVIDMTSVGFAVFFGVLAIMIGVSYKVSGLDFNQWYTEVLMCGVYRIAYSCSQLGRPDDAKNKKQWWEPAFAFYWCILIKYINPAVLYFIVVGIIKTDIEKPYEKYATYWQVIGFMIPL